jgi:hydrogenase nickel incorporation protein HypA/HybF
VHELSICDSIARAAIQNAGGRRVRSVQLRVGALRQVVPDTLIYCWSVVSRGPLLKGSVLTIDVVPAEIECGDCSARSKLSRFVLSCPDCGGCQVTVVAGEELLVISIDVVGDLDPPGAPAVTDPAATVVPTRE